MRTYELSLTPNYVSDWNLRMAVRELIQNGIDQEVLDKNNRFEIYYENGTIRFSNTKSALKINTLLLGKSTKTNNEDTVGQFGEGYKISALVLNRLGKTFTVYNHSKNEVWTTRFVNSRRWHDKILVFDVDDNATVETGLAIEVGNISSEEWDDLQEIWLGFQECSRIHTTYGDILTDESQKNKVYVNGLFISCSADLKYGYDFKPQYLKLERDRMSCDNFDARKFSSKMVNEAYINGSLDPSMVHEMIDDDNDDVSLLDYDDDTTAITESYLLEFDQEHMENDSLDKKEKDEILRKPIPIANQKEYDYAAALGGNPVFVSYRIAGLLNSAKQERLSQLSDYVATHESSTTPVEMLENWYNRFSFYLPMEADKELKKIMELLK